jgi:hypothetical protein
MCLEEYKLEEELLVIYDNFRFHLIFLSIGQCCGKNI